MGAIVTFTRVHAPLEVKEEQKIYLKLVYRSWRGLILPQITSFLFQIHKGTLIIRNRGVWKYNNKTKNRYF